MHRDTERLRELYGSDGIPASDLAQIPAGRLGTAKEIAGAVCFLASDQAAYVTGTMLPVDGGLMRSL